MGCGGIIAHISEGVPRNHNISRRCHVVNIIINILLTLLTQSRRKLQLKLRTVEISISSQTLKTTVAYP
jgi:hypothetical protein